MTVEVRFYLLSQRMLDTIKHDSFSRDTSSIRSIWPALTHLKLAWLLKLHCVGQAFDNKLCDLSALFKGILWILVRESVKLPATDSLNFRYDSAPIHLNLDVFLNHFLDTFEQIFGASCRAFIQFVQNASTDSCLSTSCRELGFPVIISTQELQEVLEDILTVYTLRNDFCIASLYNDFLTLGLRIPYPLRVSYCAALSAVSRDPSHPQKIVSGLSRWLNAKSSYARDECEHEALVNFVHLTVLIETGAIDWNHSSVITALRGAIRHQKTFPAEIRKRVVLFLLSSTNPTSDLAIGLRRDLRTNEDVPGLTPNDLFRIVLRQKRVV